MLLRIFQNGMKLAVALSLMPVSLVPVTSYAAGKAQASKCEAKPDPCKAAVKAYDLNDQAFGPQAKLVKSNIKDNTGVAEAAFAENKKLGCAAQEACEKEQKKCKKPNCSEKECEYFKNEVTRMTNACVSNAGYGTATAGVGALTGSDPGTNTPGTGEGGSSNPLSSLTSSPMAMGLLGAAAGLGIAMMMNKKKDDSQQQAMPQVAYNGALQPNGSIDCSKPDALFYGGCNPNMEKRCASILDDPLCQQFSSRYCGPIAGAAPVVVAQPMTPPGVVFAVDPSSYYGAQGEGASSAYCRGVVAWNFCKVGGRESCPSCQQIQRNQSPACVANPAACLAQNSSAQVQLAVASCPAADPAFMDPAYAAAAQQGAVSSGGVAAVVLPQSAGTAPQAGGGSPQVATSTVSTTMSAQSAKSNDQGLREGVAGNVNSQANYAPDTLIGSPQNFAGGGGLTGGREFASTNSGSGTAYKTASVSGPASDVEGKYGPSLFSTSSQVIRKRCQAGRLNNCP